MEQLLCLEEPKKEEEGKSQRPSQQLGKKNGFDGFSYDCATLRVYIYIKYLSKPNTNLPMRSMSSGVV